MDNFFAKANKIMGILWQLAENYPNSLKEKIQNHSLYFISQLSFNNWQEAQKALLSLKNFLSLANYIGILRLVNFEIINNEIQKLEEQIVEFKKATTKEPKEMDLREVFAFEEKKDNKYSLKNIENEKSIFSDRIIDEDNLTNKANKEKENHILFKDLTYRQKQIVDLLSSQKKPLQSSEISEAFPLFSARTIRNELSILCQRNILKRQGVGRKIFYSLNDELLKIQY